jgi:hypothetical protein
VVRTWLIGLAVVIGVAGTAAAQAPQGGDAGPTRVRQQIFMVEGVLERAVQLGVDNLRRRMRSVMPDDALLQGGAPQARGFLLEGYGVFFDVEVPAVRRSFAWSMRAMNETGVALARDLAQMRAFMQAIADPRLRTEFDRALQRIQRQMAPTPGAAARTAAAQAQAAVAAQSVPAPDPAAAPAAAPADAAVIVDPGQAYVEEVKAALVTAMIDNSGPLVLAADEWFTVAARDGAQSNSLVPGDRDGVTLVLRLKGSDLAAFRAGRLTLDQVKARIAESEF